MIEGKILSSLLHRIVLGVLDTLTLDDIKYMIDNDLHVKDTLNLDYNGIKGQIAKIGIKLYKFAHKNPDTVKKYANVNVILKEMEEHRPQLLPLFSNAKAKQWLKAQIDDLLELLDLS